VATSFIFSSWTENTEFLINDPCWGGHIIYYASHRIASMDEESCNEYDSSHVVWARISVFKIKYNDIYIIYQMIENIKRIFNYAKSTTILYNYWYFIMATCFGFSLDHLKANLHKWEVKYTVCTVYCGIPYYDKIYDIFVNCNWVFTQWQ
jgi:hypothetical protein